MWIVEVVSLLPTVATPIVAPLVVPVLVSAAASGFVRAAAADASVVAFEVAVRGVAIAASLFLPVMEFLTHCGASISGSVSGSGTEFDSGSGSGSTLVFI